MESDKAVRGPSSSMMPAVPRWNAPPGWTLLSQKRVATNDRIQGGKEMLARVVAMLTRLVQRFDPDEFRIREDVDRDDAEDL